MTDEMNIYKALANFQSQVKPIPQNSKGYNYTYADLATIFENIKPLLATNDLMVYQPLDGKSVKTILVHLSSGDTIESVIDIPQDVDTSMNAYQSLGSAITYLRRYSLASLLGLVTDEDTDATTKPTNQPTGGTIRR